MPRFRALLSTPNLARLAVLAVLLFSLHELHGMKPPWKSTGAKHHAEGREMTFREHVSSGLWYGAAVRAGLCGVILVVSLGWGLRTKGQPEDASIPSLRRPDDWEVSPSTFGFAVGVIVLAALAMRLPRMTHSFWGDEADAIATYVHGEFRPVDKKEPEGKLSFEQPSWEQTFFGARHGANNHVLFSVCSRLSLEAWRKITGKPRTEFAEWAARVPSLLAGLGSLLTTALLMRRWGWSLLGLVTVTFMAFHPWHVRYSTEARGYAMMLLLFPLLLMVLTDALEKNRWRDWLIFALCEFLLMYSWAGIMYALITLNLAAAILMLGKKNQLSLCARWITAGLLAGIVFLSLFLPLVTQIQEAGKRLLWTKGQAMDAVWFHNIVTQPFTGIPYHDLTPANPAEISWQRLFSLSLVITTVGFAIILVSFLAGSVIIWRRSRPVAWLTFSVLIAAVLCVLHFKYVLQDELRAWYLIFTLPVVCLFVALAWLSAAAFCARRAALRPAPVLQAGVILVFFLLAGASLWPMNASMISQPEENYKGAAAVSVGRHGTFSPDAGSNVSTIWLWRFSPLYDPRGDTQVRSAQTLRDRMEKSRQSKNELYVIVGHRALASLISADMLAILDDPAQFEKTATFPARESLHTLEVYRLKQP